MPAPNEVLALDVERPAVGGAMIARVDGQVVLVTGAIPGERVEARVDRVGRGVLFASTVAVKEPSQDRRAGVADPACGGCGYAHISYERQLVLKSEVIADAFARIGRFELPSRIAVAPSREDGYRMRARLHVRGGRLGFFREGTHDICDPRPSRQLLPETYDVLDRLMTAIRSLGDVVREVELSENIDATERVVHVETAGPVERRALEAVTHGDGLTAGPFVTDVLDDDGRGLRLRRHVLAFFQGNRYLIRRLVRHVAEEVDAGSRVLDLYAGAGLFSLAAADRRGARVIGVEGDRFAASDLTANARACQGAEWSAERPGIRGTVEAVASDVESFVANRMRDASARNAFDAVIVDPPRTGMSPAALRDVVTLAVPRLIYVSCDVATLARDSRALMAGGYQITRADAFDMFPNTPHVEAVVVFVRR
jgi:23S rRNA (uracil1939-C5)-methyltransferase